MCINKAYEKSSPVVHTYNNKKKNIVLQHSPKIPEVNQCIDFCFVTIIRDNENNNIQFYLRDIMKAYIESTFAINHPHHKEKPGMTESIHNFIFIRLPPKPLSLPNASFDYCGWSNLLAIFSFACNTGA